MISNEDPRDFYQRLDTPGVYGDFPLCLQIHRGKLPSQWKDAHPGGCSRHFEIFHKFQIIPEYCFGCYKVLVEPTNVMEHFKLLILFERLRLPDDNTRKCMVETRADCSGTYKGYVYCRGLKEGQEVYDIVRRAVAEEISYDIPVTLKRGCSEFNAAYPGYSSTQAGVEPMEYITNWRIQEEEFDKGLVYSQPKLGRANPVVWSTCPPWEVFAMTYWLGYAATTGDNSYLEIAGRTLPPIPGLNRPPFIISKKPSTIASHLF